MARDYEQSARDHSAKQRDTLRELLGDDVVIHVDMHGVATIRADVLIVALRERNGEIDSLRGRLARVANLTAPFVPKV